GRANRVATVDDLGVSPRFEVSRRLRKGEVDLPRPSREPPRREPRVGILLLQRYRDAVQDGPPRDRTARVPAGADHQIGREAPEDASQSQDGPGERGHQAPVLPRPRATDRLDGEQGVWQTALGQDPRLDAAFGAHEMNPGVRLLVLERIGEGERRVEMPPRAATGEQGARRPLSPGHRGTSVERRATESRMPTATKLTKRPLRPYDMNGRVTPVVGSRAR